MHLFAPTGVALGGKESQYDNLQIGYDNNADDIDDAGDDIVVDEGFGSTGVTKSHDDAGSMIDDDTFRYVYGAWSRLVAVKSPEDSGATTFQAAESDAIDRRIIRKSVRIMSSNRPAGTSLHVDK